MKTFTITVRYGSAPLRYHTFNVEASGATAALEAAAAEIPPEVGESADLIELRVAVDPEARRYVGEDA